ncbi:unnamed protein product, partial [Laminaria digitata]
MGAGADDMVASLHSMSIGVGEVVGPLLGGFVVDLLPRAPAFACEPGSTIMRYTDPIFQVEQAPSANPLPEEASLEEDSPEDFSGKIPSGTPEEELSEILPSGGAPARRTRRGRRGLLLANE